jgi:hypothetical protein
VSERAVPVPLVEASVLERLLTHLHAFRRRRAAPEACRCAPRRRGRDQRRAVRILRGTSVDDLAIALADRLATRPPADPFAPVDIAVPAEKAHDNE